jgi:hypothetical protein
MGESVAADATVRDEANRLVGGDSILEEFVAANATVWEGVIVDSNAEAVPGVSNEEAGAFWVDADRRSPILAFDLELDSDPIGSGAQPTNPANNVTSASSLKPELCDMASSNPGNIHGGHFTVCGQALAQIAFSSELARP